MTFPEAIQYVLEGGRARREDWPYDWYLEGTPPLLNGRHYNPDAKDYTAKWMKESAATILQALEWVQLNENHKAKLPGMDWWLQCQPGYGIQVRDESGWFGDNSSLKIEYLRDNNWCLLED